MTAPRSVPDPRPDPPSALAVWCLGLMLVLLFAAFIFVLWILAASPGVGT